MKHMKPKKILALTLSLSLLAGALSGCGQSGEASKTPSSSSEKDPDAPSETGRYVEQEVSLPAELTGETILQMFKSEDRLHLLTSRSEEETLFLREWELGENGFQDVTGDWLTEMSFPDNGWMDVKLVSGTDHRQYLYAAYLSEDGEFGGHLWKGTGSSAEEITPEKWSVPDEDTGIADMIQGLAVLEDGSLAVSSLYSLDILSGEDGSILESEPADTYYDGILSVGKNLYLLSSDSAGAQIEMRPEAKKKDSVRISFAAGAAPDDVFSIGRGGSVFLDALTGGSLIAAAESGIYRLTEGNPDADWELLAPGQDTDFSLPNLWCLGLNALEDGRIFALFQVETGQKLNCYQYDPQAVTGPQKTLTLYSIYENTLLKQAAILYHKAHPEVTVELQYEYSLYSPEISDYDSVYKKLNTLLMGDQAPDLLVMDHLNAESYISKGLLENLEDVIRPLEDNGQLLSNITRPYLREDGTRYVVPLEFGFQLALGRDILPENMSSLEALSAFLSQAEGNYLGHRTTEGLVRLFYPFFCDQIIREKQLDREALAQNLEYLKAIADHCGLVDSYSDNESTYGLFSLAAKAKLAFYPLNGFSDCLMPMSMVDYIKGDFAAFENRFLPSAQLAICKTCRDLETAKDFLQFALSLSVQNSDTFEGFPVNREASEALARKDRSDSAISITVTDDAGGYLNLEGKPYSPETAERLLKTIQTLDRPVREDPKIQDVLTEYLGDYLRGSRSLEETLQKIEDDLKMYLAE